MCFYFFLLFSITGLASTWALYVGIWRYYCCKKRKNRPYKYLRLNRKVPTYENVPRVELDQPEEGGDEGGLARPCAPHDPHALPTPAKHTSCFLKDIYTQILSMHSPLSHKTIRIWAICERFL